MRNEGIPAGDITARPRTEQQLHTFISVFHTLLSVVSVGNDRVLQGFIALILHYYYLSLNQR